MIWEPGGEDTAAFSSFLESLGSSRAAWQQCPGYSLLLTQKRTSAAALPRGATAATHLSAGSAYATRILELMSEICSLHPPLSLHPNPKRCELTYPGSLVTSWGPCWGQAGVAGTSADLVEQVGPQCPGTVQRPGDAQDLGLRPLHPSAGMRLGMPFHRDSGGVCRWEGMGGTSPKWLPHPDITVQQRPATLGGSCRTD